MTDHLISATTVAALVDASADRDPYAPALWCPDARLTYGELVAASMLSARRLHAAGVRHGDRVGFFLAEASAEYIALLLGALRLGAITVVLNARYKARELTHAAGTSGLKVLLTSTWFDEVLDSASLPAGCRVVTLDDGDAFRQGGDGVAPEEISERQAQVAADDPARIIFTSGTTANPKGCLHSHRAIVAQAEAVAERLKLTAEDRYWTPLPFFHTAGWTILAALARGGCAHHAGRFVAEASLRQIESERCTVLFPGFETLWMDVLTLPAFETADLSAVRLVLNVGSPERMRVMQRMFPTAPQVSNTGCTECSGWLAIGEAADSPRSRAETCGRPLPGMEVRIIDPESGEDVPANTPGELLFRGPARLTEYYGDPDGTAAAIDADGWFHTGDLQRQEPDGALVFLARLKDMLKVGGENVAAAEIEDLLLSHPAVHIAQVVAAPDARYGEVPAAFVELRPGASASEQELITFSIGKIATFKVPRYARIVTEWPMSGTKIKKVDLRARIARELDESGVTQAPPIR
jgi:fatty-acyl-CoA synthase